MGAEDGKVIQLNPKSESADKFSKKNKGAEFYENNPAENFAEETAIKVESALSETRSDLFDSYIREFDSLEDRPERRGELLDILLNEPISDNNTYKFHIFLERSFQIDRELGKKDRRLEFIEKGLKKGILDKDSAETLALEYANEMPELKRYIKKDNLQNISPAREFGIGYEISKKPKIGTLSRVKYEYQKAKSGFKRDVNNIVNGFKGIFSSSKRNYQPSDEIIRGLKNAGATFEEFKITILDYIEEGNKKWNDEPAWEKERERAMNELEIEEKEYKLETEKKNSNEVFEIEKDFQNDSTEALYDRLARSGHDKKTNFAEASINILYSRNELQFDNPNLWKALENLSNNQISFKNAQELNSQDILLKVKEAVELIWSKEHVRKWGIENKENSRVIRMNRLGDDHDDASTFAEEWKNNKAA